MVLTVGGVLALDVFSDIEVTLLTSGAGTDATVRWVHASELPDIARYLTGGELLLTAGLGMGRTARAQRAYVEAIAEAGAVALVVEESGRMFDRVPSAAVAEAEHQGLPLIALAGEVPFAGVSAQFHEHLTNERVQRLIEDQEIDQAFSQLLLDGADVYALVTELGSLTGRTVVLENLLHHVVAIASSVADLDLTDESWSRHAARDHDSDPNCLLQPIVLRGQAWGALHLVLDGSEPMGRDHESLRRAASAVAISLLSERTVKARRGQRSTSLVTQFLLGDVTGRDLVRRARALGYQLPEGQVIAVSASGAESGPEAIQAVLDESPYLFADVGSSVFGMIPAGALSREILPLFTALPDVWVGHSRPLSIDEAHVAVRQAQTASSVASSTAAAAPDGVLGGSKSPKVIAFDDLGVERLLAGLAGSPELAAYVEDELGSVLDHDMTSANPLLPTLQAFIAADGRKSDAAATLFIQRRTLYNRLERLSTVLGQDVESPDTRQRLLLAVKGLELVSPQRGPFHRPW